MIESATEISSRMSLLLLSVVADSLAMTSAQQVVESLLDKTFEKS